jgi:hypothetical protein
MTESQAVSSAPFVRRREIDFLRGIALIFTTMVHPLRLTLWGEGLDPARLYFLTYGELFSAFFLFISAINVTNFLNTRGAAPGFDVGRFYRRNTLALFLMGSTYNLSVGTIGYVDIIQIIALGTLFTYALVRSRASTIGLVVITLLIFYLRLRLVGSNVIDEAVRQRLVGVKYFIALFGPLPWLGFFSFALLIDRIPRGRAEITAMVLFFLLFLLGHRLPRLEAFGAEVTLYKTNLRYLVMACGLMPVMYLSARRWYHGDGRLGRTLEALGRESLIFLCFHWAVLGVLFRVSAAIMARVGETVAVWSTAGLMLLIMVVLTPRLARLRDRWMKRRGFSRTAWIVFAIGVVGWVCLFGAALITAHAGQRPLAAMLRVGAVLNGFIASFTFSFLYPHVRARLREKAIVKL